MILSIVIEQEDILGAILFHIKSRLWWLRLKKIDVNYRRSLNNILRMGRYRNVWSKESHKEGKRSYLEFIK